MSVCISVSVGVLTVRRSGDVDGVVRDVPSCSTRSALPRTIHPPTSAAHGLPQGTHTLPLSVCLSVRLSVCLSVRSTLPRTIHPPTSAAHGLPQGTHTLPLSVCPSVRLSVTLVDQDHIGWKC